MKLNKKKKYIIALLLTVLMVFVGGVSVAISQNGNSTDTNRISGKYYGAATSEINEMDVDRSNSSIIYSYSYDNHDRYGVVTLTLNYKITNDNITFYYGNKSGTLNGRTVKTNDVIGKGKIISKSKIKITENEYKILLDDYSTTKNSRAKNSD